MARGAGLAGRVSSHNPQEHRMRYQRCDAASALAIEAWRRHAGAPACSMPAAPEWRVQLLHLRRPGVAAPLASAVTPGACRTVKVRASCRRSSFDVSSRQPQPAPHDPNRPHTATQQALVTTLLFAWRRTVSSEPTGVGAAAEHHGKRVTDLHIN